MSRPWSRITRREGEKRVTWAHGDLDPTPHVIASGGCQTEKEAREMIRQSRERDDRTAAGCVVFAGWADATIKGDP